MSKYNKKSLQKLSSAAEGDLAAVRHRQHKNLKELLDFRRFSLVSNANLGHEFSFDTSSSLMPTTTMFLKQKKTYMLCYSLKHFGLKKQQLI